jgi:hypothetical protein
MGGGFELVEDRSGSVLPALRAACPTFESRWQAHVATWAGEPAGRYNDISAFAHHLVDLLERNQTAEFPEVFAIVERLLAADEVGVRELITVGLLEDLQSIAMSRNDPQITARFRTWLGPITAMAWDEVHRFWGTPDSR